MLSTGHTLTAYNRSLPPLLALADPGAQAAANAEIVIIMLPSGSETNQRLLGKVLAAAHPGALITDMSSVHPATARDLG